MSASRGIADYDYLGRGSLWHYFGYGYILNKQDSLKLVLTKANYLKSNVFLCALEGLPHMQMPPVLEEPESHSQMYR